MSLERFHAHGAVHSGKTERAARASLLCTFDFVVAKQRFQSSADPAWVDNNHESRNDPTVHKRLVVFTLLNF